MGRRRSPTWVVFDSNGIIEFEFLEFVIKVVFDMEGRNGTERKVMG